MAAVDADDHSIDRFVVWHFKYDDERHERRNVVVAAYDTEPEFLADIERRSAGLRQLQAAGAAEPVERISGTGLAAGSPARSRKGRTAWKAARGRGRARAD